MKEELYVNTGSKWEQLDLLLPSGITLNFKSMLFSDVTKVTTSNSYTFTLPATANNNKVLQVLNDIRNVSPVLGKKLPCMYKIDGIELMTNQVLYISQVTAKNEYKAVIYWGGVILDYDININELDTQIGNYEENILPIFQYASSYESNEEVVCMPYYSAGVPNQIYTRQLYPTLTAEDEETGEVKTLRSSYAPGLPCQTVHNILDKIAQRYGLRFKFNKAVRKAEWSEESDVPEIIQRGIVPIMDVMPDEEDMKERYITLNNPELKVTELLRPTETIMVGAHVAFGMIGRDTGNIFEVFRREVDGIKISGIKTKIYGMKLEGELRLTTTFLDEDTTEQGFGILKVRYGNENEDKKQEIRGTVEYEVGRKTIIYDFTKNPITIEDANQIWFEWNGEMYRHCFSELYPLTISGSIKVVPVLQYLDHNASYNIDFWKNLPPISCKEFLKSIFYISGGFPVMDKDGAIDLVSYNKIFENLSAKKYYDWSDYLVNGDISIKYSDGTLGRRNYYLMKNENLNTSSEDNDNIVYDEQFASLRCNNESISEEKTIIQLPFYSRVLSNGDNPSVETGNTFLYYTIEDGLLKKQEPKPIIGLLDIDKMTIGGQTADILTIEPWQFPADLENDGKYKNFAKIIRKPQYVECKMTLPLHILKDIDFARPVYLSQYNSIFVATDIRYSVKSGISTVTLLKIPTDKVTPDEPKKTYGVPSVTNNDVISDAGVTRQALTIVNVLNKDRDSGYVDGKYGIEVMSGSNFLTLHNSEQNDSGTSVVVTIARNEGALRKARLKIYNYDDETKYTIYEVTQKSANEQIVYGIPRVQVLGDLPFTKCLDKEAVLVSVVNYSESKGNTDGTYTARIVDVEEGKEFAEITSEIPAKSNTAIRLTALQNKKDESRDIVLTISNADDETKSVTIKVRQSASAIDDSEAHPPYIGANGNWYLWNDETQTYVDSGRTSKGDDGRAPKIGSDGYWYEYNASTGLWECTYVKAAGPKGDPGDDGEAGKPAPRHMYKRSESKPSTPTVANPTDWSITPPAASDISNVSYTNMSSTPWNLTSDGYYTSTNQQNSSESILKIGYYAQRATTINIQYKVSSERTYDKGYIGEADASNPTTSYVKMVSGEESGTASVSTSAGTHYICVAYTKDGSQYSGSDCFKVKLLTSSGDVWMITEVLDEDGKFSYWSEPIRINGSDGNDGDPGVQGCVIRNRGEWKSGTYYNDSNRTEPRSGESVRWIDVVSKGRDTSGNPIYYMVKASVSSTSSEPPSSTYWESAPMNEFVATKVLIANSADFEVATGGAMLLKNSSGTVTSGAKGCESSTDIAYWAGASVSGISSAPFRVQHDGSFTSTKGNIGGFTIGATSISGGGIILNNNGTATIGGLSVTATGTKISGAVKATGGLVYNCKTSYSRTVTVNSSDDLVVCAYNDDAVFVLPAPSTETSGKMVMLRSRRYCMFIVCNTSSSIYDRDGLKGSIDPYGVTYNCGYKCNNTSAILICDGSYWYEVSGA